MPSSQQQNMFLTLHSLKGNWVEEYSGMVWRGGDEASSLPSETDGRAGNTLYSAHTLQALFFTVWGWVEESVGGKGKKHPESSVVRWQPRRKAHTRGTELCVSQMWSQFFWVRVRVFQWIQFWFRLRLSMDPVLIQIGYFNGTSSDWVFQWIQFWFRVSDTPPWPVVILPQKVEGYISKKDNAPTTVTSIRQQAAVPHHVGGGTIVAQKIH